MKRFPTLLACLAAQLAHAADARVEFAFGVLDQARGLPTAERHFEIARVADPIALPLVQRAVAARMAASDRAGAIKLYRDLAAARPDDLTAQLIYADFLISQGNGDSLALKLASETLETSLAARPGNPGLVRRLFELAETAGNRERQQELLESLRPPQVAAVLLYSTLARKFYPADDLAARGKLDEQFQAAMTAQPENPDLARAASEYFRDTGRPAEAIVILEKHVVAAPSSLDLRTRLGVLYFDAKRDDAGEAALKAVLAISPRKPLAHQALAKFYRLHGQASAARMHSGELLKLRGGSPQEFMTLADEWLDAGDPRQARLLLEKAVFDHPGDYGLVSNLAIATRRDPETRSLAARLFREAETARPADVKPAPAFLLESAAALLNQGQTRAAEDRLRSAIRAFPADAKKETAAALRQLAGIWESENRNGDAARALKQRAEALER